MRALKILFYSIVTLMVVSFGIDSFVDVNTVEADGPRLHTDMYVSGYHALDISGSWEVILQPGEEHHIQLEIEENIREYVRISVDGNTLNVGMEGRVLFTSSPKIYISAPEFVGAEVSGASSVTSASPITGSYFELEVSGASEVQARIEVEKLKVDGSGASDITLTGFCTDLVADLSGSSDLSATGFSAKRAELDLSGASSASLEVTEDLQAHTSGASSIRYSGNPAVTQAESGASSIRRQ